MNDNSKYERQKILKEIGVEGQQKLRSAKVLVIGAGGLGCPVLSYLSSAGIGTIGIADHDVVSLSNLHRQVLYNEDQTGISKVVAAKENLTKLNSEIGFKIFEKAVNRKNVFDLMKEFEVVVDATDNFKARYLINDACVILNKPFVSGSINKFEAQVSVYNYDNGPTYRCAFPEIPGRQAMVNCEESGVIGPVCGVAGTIMATEVMKIVLNAGDTLSGKILFIDLLSNEFRKIKISRNEENVRKAFKLKENAAV